eukprot:CAMPEP_0184523390 /NCGR_PEP_ID=MMETSP0198_2-20121128/8855_1 /TAXON_ID=1112570 /ORGANISM="Thraustochytrium sp., Strain LLF1b" /LENGTH=390 /DNA_ID=CAMNT_0026914411 /DNA_START=169 /DNA_END=1338 /DNA_ORIENTATION=+
MTSQNDVLEKMLKKLEKIETKLDRMDDTIAQNSQSIESLKTGVVQRVVRFGTTDVGNACGVVSMGHNELIGESGPRQNESEARRAARRERQRFGARLFSTYCAFFAVLMAISWMDLLPVFEWEVMEFDLAERVSVWLRDNMHMPFIISLVYIIVIFSIQRFMKNRDEFDLRKPLAAWSLLLGGFSLAGSIRTVPVLFKLLQEKGVFHLLCGDTRRDWVIDNPAGVWTMFFIFSKVPELIDTLFIVLRKRKLITLHWYHHITVMTFCWHSWATFCLNGLVYSSMNLTVHAFMYVFYALTALGYRPTEFAMYITILQILQMVVGTAVTVFVNYHIRFVVYQEPSISLKTSWDALSMDLNTDPSCKVHTLNAFAGLAMYASYLWLFCVFFYVS